MRHAVLCRAVNTRAETGSKCTPLRVVVVADADVEPAHH